MAEAIDPYAIPDEHAAIYVAIKRMIELLAGPGQREFFVGTSRYLVDGEPYPGSVTVASGYDLVQTQTGFTYTGYFDPDMLGPEAHPGPRTPDGRVQVTLEVRMEDIWMINEILEAGRESEALYLGAPKLF